MCEPVSRMLQQRMSEPMQARQRCYCGQRARRGRTSALRALAPDEQQIPAHAVHILESIRVVLVAPKTPANIGAVARCCANFETLDLVLVAPRCDPNEGEVWKVACGEEVLKRMRVVDDLQAALGDTVGSVGFTRRAGATRYTHGSIAEMLQKYPFAIPALNPALQAAHRSNRQRVGTTALVFGREENGLTASELCLCLHSCAIPTGRIQGAMNLSHAVAVVLSGLFERQLQQLDLDNPGMDVSAQGSPQPPEVMQPAAASEVAALLAKVSEIAAAVGMSGAESRGGGNQGSHGRRRLPLGHIRTILSRAQANTWEVRSLHGLASAILARARQDSSGAVHSNEQSTAGTAEPEHAATSGK